MEQVSPKTPLLSSPSWDQEGSSKGTFSSQDQELLVRVKTIMVLRMVFLTGFVGLIITFELNATQNNPIIPLSLVLCIAYLFSLAYALLIRIELPLNLVGWIQVLGDLLIVGGLIYTTGGIESPLSFLYLFVIISASIILPRHASYLAASGASIIYGLLVDLEYFNIIRPIYFFPKSNISFQGAYGFYLIAMNLASFYSVAYLSNILTHRLRVIKDELEQKSQNLKKLEEFHHKVIQNMGSGLLTTDRKGLITSSNSACSQITGFSVEESLGRPCHEILTLDTLKSFFEHPAHNLPLQVNGKIQGKNRDSIPITLTISGLPEADNEEGGFICVFEDQTEIQRMEEKVMQSEQMAAVGKFSAGLAHEIRNPLASLSGSIQVLKNGLALEGDYKRLMEIVTKETERLNGIVSDFLSFSQPRRNKNRLIDFNQLIQDVYLLIKNSNEYDAEVKIVLELPPEHILIVSDEEQIKQMVWNLCLNAIQAMDAGGTLKLGLVEVQGFQAGEFSSTRNGVVFSAEDEGKGMSEDQVELIFDPFYTTRDEGVGLGLATVVKIVERFGGYIHVESQLGKGTLFKVFLPQERSLTGRKPDPSPTGDKLAHK